MIGEPRNRLPYGAFNARALSPEEVGRGFIYAAQFAQLAQRTHVLMVGPRGSGKTTLLKMLQLPALQAWHSSEATELRGVVDYVGVFIPADLVWSAQIEASSSVRIEQETIDIIQTIGRTAFNNQVLIAALASIQQRCHIHQSSAEISRFKMDLSENREPELAKSLSRCFGLTEAAKSISHLRLMLLDRTARIGRLRRRVSRLGGADLDDELTDLVDLDFLGTLSLAFEMAESYGRGTECRWALCFDELELCPADLRARLLSYLRSTDSRFLFKVALSPYSLSEVASYFPEAAQEEHDYSLVNLTYGGRTGLETFARRLLTEFLTRQLGRHAEPSQIFGRSATENRRSKGEAPYAVGSSRQIAMAGLADIDRTFSEYLQKRRLDPLRLHELESRRLHRDVRKIIHLVSIRNAYRTHDDGSQQRHKGLIPYSGVPLLYAITEGNPRLVLGLSRSMLELREGQQVSVANQARVYEEAIARVLSLYRTLGFGEENRNHTHRGWPTLSLSAFLDKIGYYFSVATVAGAFTADPPGTFIVDHPTQVRYGYLVGMAVNVGALIHITRRQGGILSSNEALVGERFRLSYLLCAHYHLPLRLDRSVPLSMIFDEWRTGNFADLASEGGTL